jgi:hypothetical protein
VTSGLIAFCGFVYLYSRLDSVWVAAPVAGLAGAALGAMNAAIAPLMIKSVPRDYLGRIFAIVNPANRIGSILSILLASALVSTVLRNLHPTIAGVHIGRIDIVFTVAAVIIALYRVFFGLGGPPSSSFGRTGCTSCEVLRSGRSSPGTGGVRSARRV